MDFITMLNQSLFGLGLACLIAVGSSSNRKWLLSRANSRVTVRSLEPVIFATAIFELCFRAGGFPREAGSFRPSERDGELHIVNVTSLAGLFGIVGYTAYAASKAAMIAFNDSLRNELAGSSIAVTNIVPSDIDTPMRTEENKTKPEACRAVSGLVKPMPVEAAVESMLTGIAKQKREVLIVPFSSRLTVALARTFPGLFRVIIDRIARRAS